jgi:intraflagellar transport protein 140
VTEPPQSAVLPQFEGLDHADEASRKALMELNFHLATGDIDAAFNAVRVVDHKTVWRSLAQMCAQSRRIDLADLCFGRLEDGGSAMLLHHIREVDPAEAAAVVVVDTQLGLYDEAKKVATDNLRFDLLAGVHQALGEWTEAMTVASSSDRIHLRAVAHQHARSLEIRGDLTEAILKYEAAGTIQFELPRLAIQAGDLRLLFNYLADHNSAEIPPRLHLWAGRFYEAHKQVDQAFQYFENAGAHREIVRLNCVLGRWDEAAKIVKRSNKRSVICFYARMLMRKIEFYSKPENAKPQIDVEKLKHDVIELFRRARQFSQAMTFARQHEMVDDILALSFSAPSALVCSAARWFEDQKEAKNAILLYSRAGRLNRALALCFALKQYDALDEISDTLSSKTDPGVLIRCGRYFVESQRWSKAAQCFALARQFEEVIQLCNKHNIKLPSSVIQELSEMKADPEVMKRFASLCEQQGAFQTAATLYVKFKDHLAAMKALIRSGETDKVIKFANLVKKRETYILAGNYLQTLNPRHGDSVFDQVVTLYKKAGATDKLGRFYEAVARIEIDEYQEYPKGLELIKAGLKLLEDTPEVKQKEQIVAQMQKKIRLIEMYLEAQANVKKDPKKAMVTAVEILRNPLAESVMRTDDVYLIMVQASVAQGNFKSAHKILEDLLQNGTDISFLMDTESIQRIYKEVGKVYTPPTKKDGDDDYDVVDDDALDDVSAD